MQKNKKICKGCNKEQYIFGKGFCGTCYRNAFPEKFLIKKSIKPKAKTAPVKPKIKKPISKQSERQIIKTHKYQKLRDAYFLEHPICEFPGCGSKEIQLHHKKGRNGKNLYMWFMSCCDFHHKYIHEHPEESYQNGWLLSRIKKDSND